MAIDSQLDNHPQKPNIILVYVVKVLLLLPLLWCMSRSLSQGSVGGPRDASQREVPRTESSPLTLLSAAVLGTETSPLFTVILLPYTGWCRHYVAFLVLVRCCRLRSVKYNNTTIICIFIYISKRLRFKGIYYSRNSVSGVQTQTIKS